MTNVTANILASGGTPPASISKRTIPDSLLDFQPSETSRRDAIVRHELGLYDLDGLDDAVTINHFGPPTTRSVSEILVPVAGGPNTDDALTLAGNLAESWNAAITILTVLPTDADEDRKHVAQERLRSYADGLGGITVETRLETGDDVVATISALTDRFDLVVIGGSEQSLFDRILHSSIPNRLDRNSQAPIFVVSG